MVTFPILTMKPQIHPFYDADTSTFSYVVFDQPHGHAAIIDPVLNYQANSATTSTQSAGLIVQFVRQQGLCVDWILETHAHADHLSAAPFLQQQLGGKIAIGAHITEVQQVFKKKFNLGTEFATDGSQFDHLLADNEVFYIGQLKVHALLVPGHTPADMAFQIEDAIFVGDTLFMPDVGTARCDFPGGDAHLLYQSIQKLLSFPDQTRLFMCHDYPPSERAPLWQSSVREQREHNIHVHDGIDEVSYIERRRARDATLGMPALILPAIQINMRAGQLPAAESNGSVYLKIPLQQQ